MASLTDRVQKIEDKQNEINSACKRHEISADHDTIISQGKDVEKNTHDINKNTRNINKNTDDINNITKSINDVFSNNTRTIERLNLSLSDMIETQNDMKNTNATRDENVQNLTTSTNLLAEKVTVLFKKSEDSNAFIQSIIKSIITALLIAGLLFIFSNAYKNMQNDTNNLKITNKQNILPNIQPQYITPTTRTNERTKK